MAKSEMEKRVTGKGRGAGNAGQMSARFRALSRISCRRQLPLREKPSILGLAN